MSVTETVAYEREMTVLKAQEHLEFISLIATGFGTLDEKARKELLDEISEAAEIERRPAGIDLSKLTKNEAAAVFAQFGIPVEMSN